MTRNDNGIQIFDMTLTPQNANSKGYDYIEDVFYDILSPIVSTYDILELVREYGCKLGKSSLLLDHFFGLYMPINFDSQKEYNY